MDKVRELESRLQEALREDLNLTETGYVDLDAAWKKIDEIKNEANNVISDLIVGSARDENGKFVSKNNMPFDIDEIASISASIKEITDKAYARISVISAEEQRKKDLFAVKFANRRNVRASIRANESMINTLEAEIKSIKTQLGDPKFTQEMIADLASKGIEFKPSESTLSPERRYYLENELKAKEASLQSYKDANEVYKHQEEKLTSDMEILRNGGKLEEELEEEKVPAEPIIPPAKIDTENLEPVKPEEEKTEENGIDAIIPPAKIDTKGLEPDEFPILDGEENKNEEEDKDDILVTPIPVEPVSQPEPAKPIEPEPLPGFDDSEPEAIEPLPGFDDSEPEPIEPLPEEVNEEEEPEIVPVPGVPGFTPQPDPVEPEQEDEEEQTIAPIPVEVVQPKPSLWKKVVIITGAAITFLNGIAIAVHTGLMAKNTNALKKDTDEIIGLVKEQDQDLDKDDEEKEEKDDNKDNTIEDSTSLSDNNGGNGGGQTSNPDNKPSTPSKPSNPGNDNPSNPGTTDQGKDDSKEDDSKKDDSGKDDSGKDDSGKDDSETKDKDVFPIHLDPSQNESAMDTSTGIEVTADGTTYKHNEDGTYSKVGDQDLKYDENGNALVEKDNLQDNTEEKVEVPKTGEEKPLDEAIKDMSEEEQNNLIDAIEDFDWNNFFDSQPQQSGPSR